MDFKRFPRIASQALLLMAALTLMGTAWAQGNKKSELEAERNAISARIAATQALIEDARDDQ